MPPSTCSVVVRVRPTDEAKRDHIQTIEDHLGTSVLIRKSPGDNGMYKFNFTSLLMDATQEATYEECAKDVVDSVLEGFNGTIMAYGQTGSGKTFTMSGPQSRKVASGKRAIIPRAISQVFKQLHTGDYLHWTVEASYVELYNEVFRDLADPSTAPADISIFEQQGVMGLSNVQRMPCSTPQDALQILDAGHANRATAGHYLNEQSSRSHSIFTLWCKVTHLDGNTRHSKLNMVDLAGSERSAKTGAEGAIAKEATYINKSLSFLEQIILALSRKGSQHVPYRSSKLTHFLKDSIGGNCHTRLVACIWSDAAQINETISTCRFAQRMMHVAVNAQQNIGGLSAVHGNLMKLDPLMQQYLEQMTEAAVAKERAKLYMELKQKVDYQTLAANVDELASLKDKIKELERQLHAAHSAREGQNDSSDATGKAVGGQLDDNAQQSIAVHLKAQLALLQRQLKASQEGKAESSADSNDALCSQTPGSAHSATSPPVTSSPEGLGPAGEAGLGTAAAIDLHCSASSCYGDSGARPAGGRTLNQTAASAASWRSADEDDKVSMGALKREASMASRGPSVLQRMFSRTMRRPEHESFSGFPMKPLPAEEGASNPNIVIINSLTHDQLVEMLKGRPARH